MPEQWNIGDMHVMLEAKSDTVPTPPTEIYIALHPHGLLCPHFVRFACCK